MAAFMDGDAHASPNGAAAAAVAPTTQNGKVTMRVSRATTMVSKAKGKARVAATAMLASVTVCCLGAPTVAQAIEFESFGASIDDSSGNPIRQAGAHPDVRVKFTVPVEDPLDAGSVPAEQPHRLLVDTPLGLVGDPTVAEACPVDGMTAGTSSSTAVCPVGSQIGLAEVFFGASNTLTLPVFNLEPGKDQPGLFAFNVLGTVVKLVPAVRGSDFGITVDSGAISTAAPFTGADVRLWGVPADPSHDTRRVPSGGKLFCFFGSCYIFDRGGALQSSTPSQSRRRPFLTTPTSCPGTPGAFTGRMDGWQSIGNLVTQSVSEDLNGVPFENLGCARLPFDPSIDVRPSNRVTDGPSGLDVSLVVPQGDSPDGLATAHVKDVKMVLPEGWSVSPSSAVGLGACSSAQIGLGSTDEPSCPRSSKLGTVTVETPLLEQPLTGDVILATPDDNPFGSLVGLYIVAEGSGVRVKLPGRVDLDPVTGRLTATFENNPQLPFSALKVRFDGGENASLATPTACGRYDNQTDISSWSGKAVGLTSSWVVDQGCGPRGFSPSFRAGTENPVAGGSTAFALAIGREDRTEELSTLESIRLPKGLLGHVSRVSLCSDADADAGTCGVGSRVGHVQVAAGPGGSPVWVPQRGKEPATVSLAGPYRGAPYSLSVVVPAQAGPFDLGRVVVRSALHIDRVTAQLSTGIDQSRVFDRKGVLTKTLEGSMPTIVEGIPLRVRDLRVVVDRPGFMVNPTSCAPATVDATLRSVTGESAAVGSRFQVGECASLGFTPRLGMRLTGKGATRTGRHPGLSASLRQGSGQANIAKARVTLPSSVVLDPNNSTDPKLVCDYDRGLASDCPASSVIGKATARTPLLAKPLIGDVHLVQGIRFGPTGNRIRTTPSLLVKLRGEVALDLRGQSTVTNNRLVTTFGQVPDAPVSRFDLKINGGKKGILVITRTRKAKINLCAKPSSHRAAIDLDGHNGRNADYATTVKTPCGAKAAKKAKKTGSKRS